MAATDCRSARAIVARGPLPEGGWALEDVVVDSANLRDDEVVVEMVASGICHTDLMIGSLPHDPTHPMGTYPRVLGHEGSGYVRAVGGKVSNVAPGDAVLLSFAFCSACAACKASHHSYCQNFVDLNFSGRTTFSAAKDAAGEAKAELRGCFFGQSSFANVSIVKESSLVNVSKLGLSKDELTLLAPLGCGIQTGSGTVVNASDASQESAVLVMGLGGVGLSAVMGAKIKGARLIVGVDRVQSRLSLAKEFGATHVIDTSNLGGRDLAELIKEICDGVGPSVAVESTGAPPLITAALEAVREKGTVLQVGAAPPDFKLELVPFTYMIPGKSYRGVVEGESYPPEFVPKMVEWYREGRFPVDRIVKFFKPDQWQDAIHQMHTGEAVKPVIVW